MLQPKVSSVKHYRPGQFSSPRLVSHLLLVAACWLSPGSAHAENWVVTFRYLGGAEAMVDLDSLEVSGEFIQYRYVGPQSEGAQVTTAYARCRDRIITENKTIFTPARPGTRGGNDLDAICHKAKALGLLGNDGTAFAGRSAPKTDRGGSQLEKTPEQRTNSSGSGFLVAKQSVVTNFHVVDGCKRYTVRLDTKAYPARLVATTQRNDLALLAVEGLVGVVPTLRTSAALGEDVMVAGHPLSGLLAADLIVTSGQVNSLAGLANDPSLLQISAPVQPGNSGGPLIDRSGAIVGVVISKINVLHLANLIDGDIAQNVNFAIKPEILRLFLDANRVFFRTSTTAERLDGVALAERARTFTVQVLCEN